MPFARASPGRAATTRLRTHFVNAFAPPAARPARPPDPPWRLPSPQVGWLRPAARSLLRHTLSEGRPPKKASARVGARARQARQNQFRTISRPLDGLYSSRPRLPAPGNLQAAPQSRTQGAANCAPPAPPAGAGARPPRKTRAANAPPAPAPKELHGGPAPDLRPKRPAQTRRGSGRRTGTPDCQGSR